jgi:hypothetical protein
VRTTIKTGTRIKSLLIKQALFGNTQTERISGLVLLSEYDEPDIGWLIESLLQYKEVCEEASF